MTTMIRSAVSRAPRLGLARLFEAIAMRRSRQSLKTLDDHILSDIGLTREQALAEADRAAWDVLPTWRR